MDFDRTRADPASDSFRYEESPFYWLARVVGRYHRDMDVMLKRIGMDVPRWRVLMTLVERSPASVSELAEIGVTQLSTMTKTVQRLEAEGLVETRRREGDGRVTEVVLTGAGRAAVERVRRQASRVFHQAFDLLTDEELGRLNGMLRAIFRNLENIPD